LTLSGNPTHRQTLRAAPIGADPRERLLLQIVDGCLAGVIFLVPLLMGGRHPVGQLALATLAAVMGLAWAAHQYCSEAARWRPTAAMLLLVAGAALVLLQTLPLPAFALGWLAPHNADLLPLWNSADPLASSLGGWHCISMTPADTRVGLAIFLAYGLVFFVAAQRIAAIEDVERLLQWCALSAVSMAVLGLAQLLAGNGKFLWFYQHPFADTLDTAKGSFSNRNHFAQFLALGIGPLIWWLQDAAHRMRSRHESISASRSEARRRELQTYLLALALAVVVFANLLSLSRGGIMAAFVAVAICTAICYRASAVGGKAVAGVACAGLLIGLFLAIFGYDRVADRLDTLSSGSLEKLDNGRGRRMIWEAAAKAIPDHLLLGAGVGSFREVYPAYANIGVDDIEFTHGENCYLQVALETGGTGLALVLAGIVLCGWWCFRGFGRAAPPRLKVCAGAIAAGLAAAVVHGAVDFVWYVPACSAMVAVLAACALRIAQMADHRVGATRTVPLPRFAPATAALLLLPAGGWMVATCIGPAWAASSWDEYLLTVAALQAESHATDASASPQSPQAERKLIACLEKVVDWQPAHARAHLELSEAHLRLFDQLQATAANSMSLVNIRDAVLQSQFPSQQAMLEWLSRAVGDHVSHLQEALRHTRSALALCPLEGRGYIYLAELCFLDGNRRLSGQACVEQALRVRPFDGAVLYAAGSAAYLAGDPVKWLDYAKRAFHCGRKQQRQLIGDLIGHTPEEGLPEMIALLLREFQPDLEGMRFLYAACAKRCRPEQLAALRRAWAEKAEREAQTKNDPAAASLWLEAQGLYAQLNEGPRALQCARSAIKSDPGNYQARYELALRLIERQQFAEAESHLHWCLQRTPDEQSVQAKLKEALRGRLDAERRAAAGAPRLQ